MTIFNLFPTVAIQHFTQLYQLFKSNFPQIDNGQPAVSLLQFTWLGNYVVYSSFGKGSDGSDQVSHLLWGKNPCAVLTK